MSIADINSDLIKAATSGDLSKVKSILEEGVGGSAKNEALVEASASGYKSIVKLLLENGADNNCIHTRLGSPLTIALFLGHTSVVELLLSKKANVRFENSSKKTPLDYAAGKGNIKMVNLLLSHGTNLKDVKKDGRSFGSSALGEAIHENNQDIVKLLLDKGVDPSDTSNGAYKKPLLWAREHHWTGMEDLLCRYGAHE